MPLSPTEHQRVLRETKVARNAAARRRRLAQLQPELAWPGLPTHAPALTLRLEGVVSWQRPREQPLRGGFHRTAYPAAYAAGRTAWRDQVVTAVRQARWRPRPVAEALSVKAEVVAGGKLDTDRVATALLDALEGGGALVNDCRVWQLHVVRRRPLPGEAPHVAVILSRIRDGDG